VDGGDTNAEATTGDGGTRVQNAPASGSKGVKRLKVAKGKAVRKSQGSSSAGVEGGAQEPSKLHLMQAKFEDDKKRKNAAFAAEVFANKNLPTVVHKAAEKMLLAFFECDPTAATGPGPSSPNSCPPAQDSNDSEL